jgi:hypothetical protein
MTPSEVSRRNSKGRTFDTVFKKGYRYNGMCAGYIHVGEKRGVRAMDVIKTMRHSLVPCISFAFVSGCDATHCNKASALQTRLLAADERVGGESMGYTLTTSCRRAAIVPKECHKIGARSGKDSRRLLSSRSALSL